MQAGASGLEQEPNRSLVGGRGASRRHVPFAAAAGGRPSTTFCNIRQWAFHTAKARHRLASTRVSRGAQQCPCLAVRVHLEPGTILETVPPGPCRLAPPTVRGDDMTMKLQAWPCSCPETVCCPRTLGSRPCSRLELPAEANPMHQAIASSSMPRISGSEGITRNDSDDLLHASARRGLLLGLSHALASGLHQHAYRRELAAAAPEIAHTVALPGLTRRWSTVGTGSKHTECASRLDLTFWQA